MRGFPIKEYQNRVLNLQKKMRHNNLDVILLTSPHNFRYFTGLDSYFWESPARPWFLLISKNDDPIAVIPSIGKTALQKTWIKNIKTWSSPQPKDEGVSTLTENIFSIIADNGIIGCEFGVESQLRMSFNDFNQVQKNLINHKFIDASPLIWKLRNIKSVNEIQKIKKITSIASNVFDLFPDKIHIGMSEIEACNIFKKSLIDFGADHTLYMSCASGQGGYEQIICDPTDKKIEGGDILIIDTGTTRDGYFCDFDRNFGFGKIESETKDAYAILWEVTEKGMEASKPGATCADVCNAMLKILKEAGHTSNNVGRMGHGLGLQLTETPSIMPNDMTVLQENMIITIEPSLEYKPNKMLVHEENILITKHGYERLTSRTPKKLPIIKN